MEMPHQHNKLRGRRECAQSRNLVPLDDGMGPKRINHERTLAPASGTEKFQILAENAPA